LHFYDSNSIERPADNEGKRRPTDCCCVFQHRYESNFVYSSFNYEEKKN
jgi:hypothetical protein